MSIFKKIAETISNVIGTLTDFLTRTNDVAKKYGPKIRDFVIETADTLEENIPDHGYGSTKLMIFDGALKIFVDELKEKGEVKEGEENGIFEFAHFILEGYVAAQKAVGSWKKEDEKGSK